MRREPAEARPDASTARASAVRCPSPGRVAASAAGVTREPRGPRHTGPRAHGLPAYLAMSRLSSPTRTASATRTVHLPRTSYARSDVSSTCVLLRYPRPHETPHRIYLTASRDTARATYLFWPFPVPFRGLGNAAGGDFRRRITPPARWPASRTQGLRPARTGAPQMDQRLVAERENGTLAQFCPRIAERSG